MPMVEIMNRGALKQAVRELLAQAQVSPKRFTALYLLLGVGLALLRSQNAGANVFYLFLAILTGMMSLVLDAGFVLYCMAIRRREQTEYAVLFDGFSQARKIISLVVIKGFFVALWSLLFVIPGIVAVYRYRFALYNLLENPDLTVMEAIGMSSRQTRGYKWQLFGLDVSYVGWQLLALLPYMVHEYLTTWQIISAYGLDAEIWRYRDMIGDVFGIPALAWSAGILVWQIVVALYYFPNRQCVELDFFEAAKRTSGIGRVTSQESPSGGPGDGGELWKPPSGGGDSGGTWNHPSGGDSGGTWNHPSGGDSGETWNSHTDGGGMWSG